MSNSEQSHLLEGGETQSSAALVLTARRKIGSPGRSASRVGRDNIIVKMQQFMRQKVYYDFQRKEIAEFADVTPALISYYFPEKYDLVLEASSPAIMAYSDDVSKILHSRGSVPDRAKALIRKFLELGLESGYTIDYFLSAIQRRNKNGEVALVAEQYAAIHSFMEELAHFSDRPSINAGFLQSSIWGQCIYLSRQPHLQGSTGVANRATIIDELTLCVHDLLMQGLSISSF